jgi:hypothetical protein
MPCEGSFHAVRLNTYNAWRLTEEQGVAAYFEQAATAAPPQGVANMISAILSINQSNAGGGGHAFMQPAVA